ncbi:hypothetical protein ACWELB_47285, partial [Streptomyces asiaticus]
MNVAPGPDAPGCPDVVPVPDSVPGPGAVVETRWNDWKAWVAKNDAAYHIGDTPAKVQQQW